MAEHSSHGQANDYCVKCKKCGDKLPWDTGKRMTYCSCGLVAVDGCEYYTRIIGEEENFEMNNQRKNVK